MMRNYISMGYLISVCSLSNMACIANSIGQDMKFRPAILSFMKMPKQGLANSKRWVKNVENNSISANNAFYNSNLGKYRQIPKINGTNNYYKLPYISLGAGLVYGFYK